MIKKKLTIILLTVCILCILPGCGSTIKSKSEIKKDVEMQVITNPMFSTDSFDITNRLTDKKGGTDKVWTNIVLKSDLSTITYDLLLVYDKYDQGWVLNEEKSKVEGLSTAALKTTVTEEDANIEMQSLLDGNSKEVLKTIPNTDGWDVSYDLDNRETDWEHKTDTFYYTIVGQKGLRTITSSCMLIYYPNQDFTEWEFGGITEELISEEWDVIGTWQYSSDIETLIFTIDKFDVYDKDEIQISHYSVNHKGMNIVSESNETITKPLSNSIPYHVTIAEFNTDSYETELAIKIDEFGICTDPLGYEFSKLN